MKKITLCADDYGQDEAISQGIIGLIENKRISATSCMVNMPNWLVHATQLKTHADMVDVGLHFNLTEGKALSHQWQSQYGKTFPSLKTLLIQSCLKGIDYATCYTELEHQLNFFEQHYGRMPDFIDGHQHVHHLPVIRKALLSLYRLRCNKKTYLRISSNGWLDLMPFPKQTVIALTGALQLKKACSRYAIPHNQSFAGIYDFNPQADYARLFQKFLSNITNQGLIMCHPGLISSNRADLIRKARLNEYNYFSSNDFIHDLKKNHCQLSRFSMC